MLLNLARFDFYFVIFAGFFICKCIKSSLNFDFLESRLSNSSGGSGFFMSEKVDFDVVLLLFLLTLWKFLVVVFGKILLKVEIFEICGLSKIAGNF